MASWRSKWNVTGKRFLFAESDKFSALWKDVEADSSLPERHLIAGTGALATHLSKESPESTVLVPDLLLTASVSSDKEGRSMIPPTYQASLVIFLASSREDVLAEVAIPSEQLEELQPAA